MAIIASVTVICLFVLYLCYRALPLGRGTLYGLAAVITALGGLVAALTHLLLSKCWPDWPATRSESAYKQRSLVANPDLSSGLMADAG